MQIKRYRQTQVWTGCEELYERKWWLFGDKVNRYSALLRSLLAIRPLILNVMAKCRWLGGTKTLVSWQHMDRSLSVFGNNAASLHNSFKCFNYTKVGWPGCLHCPNKVSHVQGVSQSLKGRCAWFRHTELNVVANPRSPWCVDTSRFIMVDLDTRQMRHPMK